MMHIIAELHRLQDAHQQIEDALFDWCSTFFGKSHSPTLTDIDVSTNER